MSSKDNKWLIVKPTVILTPIIEPVIVALDKFFEQAKLQAYVTSGLRDANNQLEVIRGYLIKKGLAKQYPQAMAGRVDDFEFGEYSWQMAWSHLLNLGVIINPPVAAKCLMHTTYDKVDRFGKTINQTPHAKGNCFDVGGATGLDPTIKDELVVIDLALKIKVPGLLSRLPEPNNGAIHLDCIKIK